jgi:hypothetical protein
MTPTGETRGRLVLLGASLLFVVFGLELGCRLWRGPEFLWHWPNLVVRETQLRAEAKCGFVRDPLLGYVPAPSCTDSSHAHDAQGFRLTPPPPGGAADRSPILIAGDSYTYGDEVADGESWPAYLPALVHRRVVNAGVPGYGLDQTVLRAEQLAASLRPAAIVVGFIADDLHRNEMSRLWGGEKPYFELQGDTLELRNVPPPLAPIARGELPFWQRMLGWSMLVDRIVRRMGWYADWYWDDVQVLPNGAGERLACPLMRRLANLRIPTVVVAQYLPQVWKEGPTVASEQRRLSQGVLRCAADAGLGTLDSFPIIDAIVRTRGAEAAYRVWHHTPEANRLIANAVAADLNWLQVPP